MKNHPDLPADAPQWLRDADIERPIWHDGDWRGGVWRGGVWRGGVWLGGEWRGGVWRGGEWRGGVWRDGDWRGGVWLGGEWLDGDWRGGEWCGGVWRGGVWLGGEWLGGEWLAGEWRGSEDRLLYMAARLGVVFGTNGVGVAYRITQADGRGRHTTAFRQPEGEFFEDDLPPPGSGTCVRGIHVTTAARAHTYFGVDPNAQFWRVEFRREDLLDCDGEKCRIRGGTFTKIARPF